MKMMKKLVISLVAIALLSISATQAVEKVSKIPVRGMYCPACAKGVEASLKSEDGVKDVQVKVAKRASAPSLVTVTYDDEKITEAKLRELISESGFRPLAERKNRSARKSRHHQMSDLTNLDQLKQLFQTDSGKVRLIALLSPT